MEKFLSGFDCAFARRNTAITNAARTLLEWEILAWIEEKCPKRKCGKPNAQAILQKENICSQRTRWKCSEETKKSTKKKKQHKRKQKRIRSYRNIKYLCCCLQKRAIRLLPAVQWQTPQGARYTYSYGSLVRNSQQINALWMYWNI